MDKYHPSLTMPIVRVALDVPLHRLFDYQLADACPADVGRRVRVPFGRGEKIGVVVATAESSEWPLAQLKTARRIEDELPPLPPDFFQLLEFASTYYQAPSVKP